MQKETVRAFKNRLRNYKANVHAIESLEAKIEELYWQMGGLKGVDPSKEPTHSMPDKDVWYRLSDQISRLDNLANHYADENTQIDDVLGRMDSQIRWAVTRVFVEGDKCMDVAVKLFLSSTGLQKRMNKAIEEALDES